MQRRMKIIFSLIRGDGKSRMAVAVGQTIQDRARCATQYQGVASVSQAWSSKLALCDDGKRRGAFEYFSKEMNIYDIEYVNYLDVIIK